MSIGDGSKMISGSVSVFLAVHNLTLNDFGASGRSVINVIERMASINPTTIN
jgi:hypothetical protein